MDCITLKMRVVLIFTISICFLGLNLFAKELKGMKKWDRIESLIFEEIQSIKKNKPLTEKKYYRVLELLSERLSILKKRENSLLINSFDELNPLIKKKKLSKLRALREKKYWEVKKLGDRALRKKISKKMKGKILFLLGLNSRDYSDGSGLVKYLKKALRYKTEKKLRYIINVELAEHFYNEKEFSKALEHYQVVLKNTKNDWYYKHYFNASWCLFRLKKRKVALNNMERILLEEKKWKYFQNKKIVMESYFIFSSFYKDIKKPLFFLYRLGGEAKSVSNYLRFAKMTSKQGLYKKTKSILEFINKKNRFELKKNKYLKANYLFFKINFLMEFKREKEYLSLLKKINKNWVDFLKKEEKNKLILSLEKLILAYQKCVYKNNKKVHQKGLCFKSFKIVKKAYLEFKRDESVKMEYFTGNVYQTLGNEKEATKSYKLAIKKSVAHKLDLKKNREYLKKALLDLIKIQLKLPKKRELLWSLKIFLNYFPHHNLSVSFYKKMFTLHYRLGHDREVESNFEEFRKKYPGQKAIITKMVNQILNKLILKKKVDKLEFWVKKIKKEKIEVPKETFKNVLGHLASFLFTKYQKMADEGSVKESKKGFYKMISGGLFSKVVVSKAYFALAFIQNREESYLKAYKSFLEGAKRHSFGKKDKTLGTMTSLLNQFFYSVGREHYYIGASLIIEKICFLGVLQKNMMMEDLFNYSLADGSYSVIKKSLDKFQMCGTTEQLKKKIKVSLDFYLKRNDFKSFHLLMKEYRTKISLKNYWWVPFVFEVEKKRQEKTVKVKEDILKLFKEKNREYETHVSFKLNSLKKMEEIYFDMKKNEKNVTEERVIIDLKKIGEIEALNEIFLGKNSFPVESLTSTPLVLNSLIVLLKKIELKKGNFSALKNKVKKEVQKYKKFLGEEVNYKETSSINDYPINKMIVTRDL